MSLCLLLVLVLFSSVYAVQRSVGIGEEYSSIQAAVDAAVSGDTVMVMMSGSPYIETVYMYNRDGIVIRGESGYPLVSDSGFATIECRFCDDLRIEGLKIGDPTSQMGLYLSSGSFNISDCILINPGGTGVYMVGTYDASSLTHCRIEGYTVQGMVIAGSTNPSIVTVSNVTVDGRNVPNTYGIWAHSQHAILDHNLILNCGIGIRGETGSIVGIFCNNSWGNVWDYSNTPAGTNNTSVDPGFCPADQTVTFAWDSWTDPETNPCGLIGRSFTVPLGCRQPPDDDYVPTDVTHGPPPHATTAILSAAPNPFNPLTLISWTLPVGTIGTLTFYDATGRYVDGMRLIGTGSPQESVWRPGNVSSGIYFAVLRSEGRQDTRQLTLIR